jgi:hypothetical protein
MLNRREVTKGGGKIAAKGVVAYVGGSVALRLAKMNSTSTSYTVETEDARFHLFHGFHGEGSRSGQTLSPDLAETKLDGFFLETGAFQYLLPDGTITISALRDTKFYKDVFPYLEKNNIPMLLEDIPLTKERYASYFLGQHALEIGAVIAGAEMAAPGGKHHEKMTRREMLKRTAGGALLGWGGTALMKYPAIADDELFRQPWAEGIRNALGSTEFMHPEDLLVAFRNAMVAEKLLYFAQQKSAEGVRKPNIGIAIGAAHSFISEYLKEGRNYSTAFINRYPDGVLSTAFGEDYDTFLPTLVEIKNDGGTKTARIYTDPNLTRETRTVEGNRPSGESRA